MLNEERIEFVHTFITTHFVMVQMTYRDFFQSCEEFVTWSMFMIMNQVFTVLAGMKTTRTVSHNVVNQLVDQIERTVGDRGDEEKVGSCGIQDKCIWCPVLGSLTVSMLNVVVNDTETRYVLPGGYLMSQDTFDRLSMDILRQTRCVMNTVCLFRLCVRSWLSGN